MLLLVCALCVGLAASVPLDQVGYVPGRNEDNPEENEGLFEGDIKLMPDQNRFGRNAFRDRDYRWPNGVVPYVIDTHHFSSSWQSKIQLAMDNISSSTDGCIKFRQRTNEAAYIKFKGGAGCNSAYVGNRNRELEITLDSGCSKIGIIMHEILHALGFWHEQNRPDRDNYVVIEWNNIKKRYYSNFDRHPNYMIDTLGQPYDYESVVHYNPHAFAIDRTKPTILVKQEGADIGQRTHLSPIDIEKLMIYYECQ